MAPRRGAGGVARNVIAAAGWALQPVGEAIDRLAADRALHARLDAIAARLQAQPGTVPAADLIERAAREHGPVTR